MGGKISTDDFVSIGDHLGRYCWLVDSGESKAWAALWTEDGVFSGIAPEPVVGRAALAAIPTDAFKNFGGKMRHLMGNLHCDYLEGRDTVRARYYNYVTTWMGGGAHFCMALCDVVLVRSGDGWLIQRNDTVLLT